MIWRTRTQLLAVVDDGFVRVDSQGMIVERYAPRIYSDEDDLWRWEYFVMEDRLIERTRIDGPKVAADRIVRDAVLLSDLVLTDNDADRAYIAAILSNDSAAREESRLRENQAAEARLAAIPRAQLTGVLARAQGALEHRVRAYADHEAARLLELLAMVARVPSAALHAAYAHGCLCACFERPEPPPIIDEPRIVVPALAAQLDDLAKRFHQLATWQEDIDARNAAVAYYNTSQALAHAAKLVGRSPTA